ncbi:MAG: N-acetyltransferase [Devosia nanyangense]|uniref:N-acetyltransferase n=1 Tax=Devosia nanyangense TaxID=1228055 RepID=A0A933L4K4_9HYPH|nr:N-acetyltransferase [Devosia nanyangense]
MIDDYAIEREDRPGHGRYVIRLPGGLEAEMTFRKIGATVIAIDHTYTPPEFRGRDIAFRLIERGIADARRDGIKIKPECSYAVAQFRRHPDWADLLA